MLTCRAATFRKLPSHPASKYIRLGRVLESTDHCADKLSLRLRLRLCCVGAMANDVPTAASNSQWYSLNAPRSELNLHFTLPTGQTFRWKKTAAEEYTGLIGDRAVCSAHSAPQRFKFKYAALSVALIGLQACLAAQTCSLEAAFESSGVLQVQIRHAPASVQWRILARAATAPPGTLLQECVCTTVFKVHLHHIVLLLALCIA